MSSRIRGKAVEGRLELCATRSSIGQSVLTHRHASGGYHLSKPYWDSPSLLVQWINPTAGIFAGDRLTSEVRVEKDAALTLTTPSATRIHTRPLASEPPGTQHQSFHVASDAALEVNPEYLIPQTGSAFQQHTVIDLEDGSAALLFAEMLAPGRMAHGEWLKFDQLEMRLQLRRSGRLLLQDKFTSRLSDGHWKLLRRDTPQFVLTVIIHLPAGTPDLIRELRLWNHQAGLETKAGITQPADGLLLIRAVSDSGLELKQMLAAIRSHVHRYDPRLGRNLRKL